MKSISEEDREKIKKQIFELNVLSQSLESEYSKANCNETKNVLKKIAMNETAEKYNLTSRLSSKLGIKRIRQFHRGDKITTALIANKREIKKIFDKRRCESCHGRQT